ncbi:MAG: amidohydrolase family protein [Planctomycetota bacterium]|jgi:predicted TIM-barrel fold metal-dependent hydrolase
MRLIDVHTHVFPQHVQLAIEVMDRCDVECAVTLEWHDGFGETLKQHLEVFNAYPGRFVVFGNVDWRRVNEPAFAERAAMQMEEDVASGMRGLKVYKALGLEYRRSDGSFWRVSDPALDSIWAKAGELDVPVLIHTADPAAFWQPLDEHNFWNGVLYGEYDWWTYYRKGYPSREELLAERNQMIARHPQTTFICPHVGSKAGCLDRAAEDLDRLSNMHYDIAARIPVLGLPGRRAAHAREFLVEYQDRVLFGTDMIYDDTNVPSGLQAQCLYQPSEIPLDGADPRERYVETSVGFLRSHLDFLTSDRVQLDPPFKRSKRGFSIAGLDLPADVCEKIIYRNARRLLWLD